MRRGNCDYGRSDFLLTSGCFFYSTGLSVVVAQFYCFRRIGNLYSVLQCILFFHQVIDYRTYSDALVHGLHR